MYLDPANCDLLGRARLRDRSLRYGLWQHCYLGKQFDKDAIFSAEGNAVMAVQYQAWRTLAVVTTRWQQHALRQKHEVD